MEQPSPPVQDWPAIPRSIRGPAGRILVRQPWRVDPAIPEVVGYWHSRERRIDIDRRMSRHSKWHVLLHEMTHAALSDVGLDLSHDQALEERICDAVAAMMTTNLEAWLEGERQMGHQ